MNVASSTDNIVADAAKIDYASILVTIGIGLLFWVVARFIILRITRRVAEGTSLFKKPHFRWVQPAFRALDHERRAQRAHTIGSLLTSVLSVVVVVIVAIYVLKYLNVDIAPLLTSVGILGVAIGFGAQQLIRDFLSGIFITIEDQFGIGDVIVTTEVIGTVESVGLRITRLRAEDGAIWYLRNGEILRVGNRSQGDYVPEEQTVPDDVPPAPPGTVPAETAASGAPQPSKESLKVRDQKAGE
ncbi:mechanosensitive ion channel family protein [Arthrobacter bambusae]|uniref:mechanosensitive ion channel family protein n=1 Tax=Arthrobacter bambusae TaxID=1338426 RepID=UPI00277EDEC6|nr:mechanosensitive ion channel domain-containing protein [Arthrobacter bambusae]MDQ0030521.1 small conductance mechanosensitive channel [Arthrobacter bambusae]MDQ0098438.1 small conductance mechanosensitive channel [Arthrobacter bambusae]